MLIKKVFLQRIRVSEISSLICVGICFSSSISLSGLMDVFFLRDPIREVRTCSFFLCQHHMYIYISCCDLWPLRAHISSCWEQFISGCWMALFMPVKPSRSALKWMYLAHECHIRCYIRLRASIWVSLPLLWKPENIRTAGSRWICRRAVCICMWVFYGLFYSHAHLTLWVLENKEDL